VVAVDAGPEHDHVVGRIGLLQPLDDVAGAGGARVALGGQDDGDRGPVVEGGGVGEAASGSPKRTLYSTTLGPVEVSMRPA